jgi:hypothetical protein
LSIAYFLPGQFVVPPQPRPASVDHFTRRCASLLAEHIRNHDSVWIGPIQYPPRTVSVRNSQFVTSGSYRNHRPRVWQGEILTPLQTPQQYPGPNPAFSREWRRFDLAMQPD